YWGIANPYPYGGTRAHPNGAAYAGPALYTDSLLALSTRSGSLLWHAQVTPPDVRDYDFHLPPTPTRPEDHTPEPQSLTNSASRHPSSPPFPTRRPSGLFWGLAHPYPLGGTRAPPNGAAYAGPALYPDSLLALPPRSGRLLWHDQVTPHDVRDYDFQLPPILT